VIGQPRMLFEMRVDCNQVWGACFDVAPEGNRLLVMEPTGSAPPLTLLQNWQAGEEASIEGGHRRAPALSSRREFFRCDR
jgi:hypothetical protein